MSRRRRDVAAAGRAVHPERRRHRWVTVVHEARTTGALDVLLLLLLPVPFLLVAHQLHHWDVGPFGSPRWIVNGDRTVIEVFGYLQLGAAAVLLLITGVRRRQGPVFAAWAATLALIVLDDSLGLHEKGGAWLNHRDLVPELFGLPGQELGELVSWGLLGLPALFVLVATHRVSSPHARQGSWWLAGLTGVLMAFAVGVDLVHEVIEELTDSGVVDLLVTFVEAGGEVGSMSLLLAGAVHLLRRSEVAAR